MAYSNAATCGRRVRIGPVDCSHYHGPNSSPLKRTLMMLLAAVQDFANGSPLLDDVSLTLIQRDAGTNSNRPLANGGAELIWRQGQKESDNSEST